MLTERWSNQQLWISVLWSNNSILTVVYFHFSTIINATPETISEILWSADQQKNNQQNYLLLCAGYSVFSVWICRFLIGISWIHVGFWLLIGQHTYILINSGNSHTNFTPRGWLTKYAMEQYEFVHFLVAVPLISLGLFGQWFLEGLKDKSEGSRHDLPG